MNQNIIKFFLFTLLVNILSCTQNPISDDVGILDRSIVKGRVKLSGTDNYKNIFIWLEGTEAFTRTDETGDFELQIPPASLQTGDGLTGVKTIYYYMANFLIDSVEVLLNNGYFVYDHGVVKKNGVISATPKLLKRFEIISSISHQSIPEDFNGEITASFQIKSLSFQDTVYLRIPNMKNAVDNIIASYLLDKENPGPEFPKVVKHPGVTGMATKSYTITQNPVSLKISIYWPPNNGRMLYTYTPGIYTAYLYIKIQNNRLPEGLEEMLNQNAQLDPNYLEYPIHNNQTSFNVTDVPNYP